MGPEAVRAVDRTVHPRLERDLGLIAAGRAEHGEVLTGRPLAALVAARTADIAQVVVSRLADGPPARPAGAAALGVGHEALLGIELLVGRAVDELDAAVDAGKSSIGVGHPVLQVCRARLGRGQGVAEDGSESASPTQVPRNPGPDAEGPCRGTPVFELRGYQRFRNPVASTCQRTCHNAVRDSGWRARARGLLARAKPATVSQPGHGRSRTSNRPAGGARRCSDSCRPRTCTSAPATSISARQPPASAIAGWPRSNVRWRWPCPRPSM